MTVSPSLDERFRTAAAAADPRCREEIDDQHRGSTRASVRAARPRVLSARPRSLPAAVDALDLREGNEVWAAVKATEVEVYPA